MPVKTAEPTPEIIKEKQLYREMGLTDGEYDKVVSILGRLPNYTETGLYSVMWSEHCSYKNSKPVLKKFPTTGKHVLQGPGEGAGVVDIGDGQAVVFKIESHNHPSAIEPYQGAATGVGGIIRDVFSMGARPIALLDSLRFGDLSKPRVKYLFAHVVAGIAGYGNCVGIPTVGGEVCFDDSYDGNPLVNAMCVGVLNHDQVRQGKAKGIGNPVVYVGASTGRDGIHGATFASVELSEESESRRPSVQVGDPFMEKLLIEACLEVLETGAVVGIQDMGAAGLVSSSSEMAAKGGTGIELNLDLLPQREENMTPYEMMLSESQERMLLVVERGREDEVKKVFDKWGLHSAVVGRVTGDGMLRLLFHGEVAAEVPATSLAGDAPVYVREARIPAYYGQNKEIDAAAQIEPPADCNEVLERLLASPTIASKRWVYEQYDYMVRTETAVSPGSDAAIITLRGANKALALTTDGNGRYAYLDPETGGAIAVAEAARNLACSGAEPLALTNCLNFGNPEKPEAFWQFTQAVEGMARACRHFALPVVSGNVSFYNENQNGAIYPTPVVGMVGLVTDQAHITTQGFKDVGDVIFLLGTTKPEVGGSEYQKLVKGAISGRPPELDLNAEYDLQKGLLAAIQRGLVKSAHDLSEGGLAVALAEACMSGPLGAHLHLDTTLRPDLALFSESQSRVLVSTSPEKAAQLEKLLSAHGVPIEGRGTVGGEQVRVEIGTRLVIDQPVAELKAVWEGQIPCLMS